MGLFTQEDPIGIAGGLNLYGYANGDPINFSDPFGLFACPDGQIDIALIGERCIDDPGPAHTGGDFFGALSGSSLWGSAKGLWGLAKQFFKGGRSAASAAQFTPFAGDLIERTVETRTGAVGIVAEFENVGTTLRISEIAIYPVSGEIARGQAGTGAILGALRQIQDEAAAAGYTRITGSATRLPSGRIVEFDIDLVNR